MSGETIMNVIGIAIIGAVFLAAQHHATATGASPAHAFASGDSHGLAATALLSVLGAAIAAATITRPRHDARSNPTNEPAAIANPV